MLSHNVMLSRNLMLSCQVLSRSAQVVSPRTSWVAAARRNLGTSTAQAIRVRIKWRNYLQAQLIFLNIHHLPPL